MDIKNAQKEVDTWIKTHGQRNLLTQRLKDIKKYL